VNFIFSYLREHAFGSILSALCAEMASSDLRDRCPSRRALRGSAASASDRPAESSSAFGVDAPCVAPDADLWLNPEKFRCLVASPTLMLRFFLQPKWLTQTSWLRTRI